MTWQGRFVFGICLILSFSAILAEQSDSLQVYRVPASQGMLNTATQTFQIIPGKQSYQLNHHWIDSTSIKISVADSSIKLGKFSIDKIHGVLQFNNQISDSISASVTYHYYPIQIPLEFQLNPRPKLLPILLRDSVQIAEKSPVGQRAKEQQTAGYSGTTNLISHGSIFRELNLSTGRGLALNSGLRMELNGTVGENIDVSAALTDQSTPLQPEGTTQTLEELDKVFIHLKNPYGEATFGDFNTDFQVGPLGQYSRKLEGVTLSGNYKNQRATLVGASSKGKFRTQQITGIDGNQGPYRLTGSDGSPDIVVLAGTERVWLDGEQRTRGATEDYTIDYSLGEITFTPRRVITSESRIVVDFQYADFQYSRSIYAGKFTSNLWNNKLQVTGLYASEADDKENPLNPVINNAVRDSLSQTNAFTQSIRVSSVSRDSTGAYVRADSAGVDFYSYVGDKNGDYTIFFSRDPNGNYVREVNAQSQFYYAYNPASSKVKYSPTVLVTPPKSHQIQAVDVQFQPNKRIRINANLAGSQLNSNTYATGNSSRQSGGAGAIHGEAQVLRWGDETTDNGVQLYGDYQNWNRQFSPLDRVQQVEFNRQWNLSQNVPSRTQSGETQSTAGINIFDTDHIIANVEWGQLNRGSDFRATRETESFLGKYGLIEQAQYHRERATSQSTNTRELQRARLQVGKNWFHPFSAWQYEQFTGDSTALLNRPEVGLLLTGNRGNQVQVSYSREKIEQKPDSTVGRISQSQSNTYSMSGLWHSKQNLNTRWDIVHRRRDYSPYYEQTLNRSDNKFTLADWSGSWRKRNAKILAFGVTWDSQWKQEQVAKREYRYLQVEQGLGEYNYDSTFADYYPDPDGDYVLRIVPGGDYQPVTGVQLGGQVSLEPGQMVLRSKNEILQKWISDTRSVTRWRYEEKSTRRTPLFQFQWQNIRNPDSTVVQHLQSLQEDLYLFQTSAYASLRYRFYKQASVNGLDARGTEIQSTLEHSLRWRATAFQPWTIESSLDWQKFQRNSLYQQLRDRDLTQLSLESQFGYHPTLPHIFRTSITIERHRGTIATESITVQLWGVGEEYTYQLSDKGRLTATLGYNQVNTSAGSNFRYLPYEVTQGNQPGDNYDWSLRTDYKINKYLTFRLQYRGKQEPGGPTYHQGSGEFRAVF